ncbi:MAG: helix-turn-helix transcriptional regulator [Acidobacteria bacterium]|nr:helix-turn-helix transcriptional regulator [Acidobacteriota bacterium]
MANKGEGLRHREESDCFFRSADWAVAFARALAIRRDRQGGHDVDAQYVPKLALAAALKELREKGGLSQTALAARLGSSQSRVGKMEAGDNSVSLDLLIKSLLTIGAGSADIARWIRRAETSRAA